MSSARATAGRASETVGSVQAVYSYRDVLGLAELDAGAALAVLDALAVVTGRQAVFAVPAWLGPRLELRTLPGTDRVLVATPERDTGSAWHVSQEIATATIPKDRGLAFEPADGARLPAVPRCERFAEVIR